MKVSFLSLDRWNFLHWLLLSLMIHASIGFSVYVAGLEHRDLSAKMMKSDKKLQIDLYGMVSDRQMKEKLKGDIAPKKPEKPKVAEKPPEPPKPKPKPKIAQKQPEVKKPVPKIAATPPVKHPKPKPPVKSPVKVVQNTPKPAAPAPAPPAPRKIQVPVVNAEEPKISSAGKGDEENKRQAKLRDALDKGEIQVYLARLTRRVRDNLVYPEAIRKKGVEGVVQIAFVVTQAGEIKAGTLVVQRSSGFAALDKSALQSATESAPFSPPKKEMRIAMNVAFTVDMPGARKG